MCAPPRFNISRPGRAGARRADGDAAEVRRAGPVTGLLASRRSAARSPCHNLSGRRPATASNRQTGGARDGRRPAGRAYASGEAGAARSAAGCVSAPRRSRRISGIRPSDRRGPGPVGHRGRNVRSTGRCSYNLRITRRRADSCGLHRSTSQVIRRSGSGVTGVSCVRARERAGRARGTHAHSLHLLSLLYIYWLYITVPRARGRVVPSFGRLSVGGSRLALRAVVVRGRTARARRPRMVVGRARCRAERGRGPRPRTPARLH